MKRSHIYQGKQWRTTGDRCVGKRRMHIRNMMIKHEQSGYPATVHISKEFLLGMAKILFWMVWGTWYPYFRKPPQTHHDPPGTSLSKHSSNDIVGAPRSTATSGASQVDSQRPRQRRFWALRTPQRASNLGTDGKRCRKALATNDGPTIAAY